MQSKITINHLALSAYIYIRQSSMNQVIKHQESQRLQYQLVERAKELGWPEPVIIDDDLGKSASGTSDRYGFQQLLTAVIQKKSGAIFCYDASRLARNNREWSKLIDYCAQVKTLIIDIDGVYNPTNVTDRVLLGMKGTMSEYELGIFRQRAQAAILEKAKRGEYFTHLPAGYKKTAKNRYDMDPDKRIQDALIMVFKKFRELGSASQLVSFFRTEKIEIPCRSGNKKIVWKLPTSSTILKILKNPIYTGAYVHGKSQTETHFIDGQPRKVISKNVPLEKWKILIKDHHKSYIKWEEFIFNQKQLEQNINKRGVIMKAAPKGGSALLVGLLRCKRCSQKFRVRYSSSHFGIPRYVCRGQEAAGKTENCISFSGRNLEQLISSEILHVVHPAAILSAEKAEQLQKQQKCEKEQHIINALKQAEYEANRCFEQYNLVDPKNRLVAQNLENDWNHSLSKVQQLKKQLEETRSQYQPLSEKQRKLIYQLAEDLPNTWNHPQADVKLKKRIVQTLIHEIVLDINENNHLQVAIHWQGGKHTQYQIKRRKKGHRENYLHPDSEQIIKQLAEITDDSKIARTLNLLRITTASNLTWSANRVKDFRNRHHILAFNKIEYDEKGLVNLQQAAEILQIFPETVRRLIKANIIKARQIVKHSPWIIDKEQLKDSVVINAVSALKNGDKSVSTKNQCKLDL